MTLLDRRLLGIGAPSVTSSQHAVMVVELRQPEAKLPVRTNEDLLQRRDTRLTLAALDPSDLGLGDSGAVGHPAPGWWDRIRPLSFGWVTARRRDGGLVGFANVAWDGSDHAFLLDPKVRPDHQKQGIGTELVRLAAQSAADAGCEWMEVDFEATEQLADFYFEACRFRPTAAGLLHLPELSEH